MDKADFEKAIRTAVFTKKSKSSTKWKPLERLFALDGYRGSGALNNDPAERTTRIRQLTTIRSHPHFTEKAYSSHCVFVLARDAADQFSEELLKSKIIPEIVSHRPPIPVSAGLESVLVATVKDSKSAIVPRALLEWADSPVVTTYKAWYPSVEVFPQVPPSPDAIGTSQVTEGDGGSQEAIGEAASNIIYFGPPGTGKSFLVKELVEEFGAYVRTVFHPEYSNADLIGVYKPVTGTDRAAQILAQDGKSVIDKPVVYYAFEPGQLTRAIELAHRFSDQPVALVIEEVNRGDCAAIFAEFFQLLDRDPAGRSEYGIRVGPALGNHLASVGVLDAPDDELFLPANLWIIATMNTSDQSLFPMDAAFKRRWNWRAVPVEAGHEQLAGVVVPAVGNSGEVDWLDFIKRLNSAVVGAGLNGDKRIGVWYVRPQGNEIPVEEIRNKLLFYLWHDVFRDRESLCFDQAVATFDEAQATFDTLGLRGVCSPLFEADGDQVASPAGDASGSSEVPSA